jgi:hypothetical protein
MADWDPHLPVTSSREPEWPPEARACYRDALQALLDANIRFAVGGAFATHKHTAIWRETKDLDFLLPAAEIPQALAQLERRGFETAIEDPVWLAKGRRGEYFVDLITGIGNASLTVHDDWIDRSVPDIVLGIPCRVLAVEESIVSKIFVAYRERFDGSDVVHLILSCGKSLDWNRILELLGQHWELLLWSLTLFAYIYPAHTQVVPDAVWEELTQRFTTKIKYPDASAPFRGSLIDPRMFAIDVNERDERNLYDEYLKRHPCLLSKIDLRLTDPVRNNE